MKTKDSGKQLFSNFIDLLRANGLSKAICKERLSFNADFETTYKPLLEEYLMEKLNQGGDMVYFKSLFLEDVFFGFYVHAHGEVQEKVDKEEDRELYQWDIITTTFSLLLLIFVLLLLLVR